jgi:hypothetical protein
VRDDKDIYPSSGWKKLKKGEVWDIDFGQDIRGGTAHLQCRYNEDDTNAETFIFYIRGDNPDPKDVKNYLTQKGYYPKYWFIIRVTKHESSIRQFYNSGSYETVKLKDNDQGKGEPLYGPPRGFGLKQLDNWGNPSHYAYAQQLWDWKANIEGGIEVLREKEQWVSNKKNDHKRIIDAWNKINPDNPVSDSLKIVSGPGIGTWVLTINEGGETFAVDPTTSQRNIYDALFIRYFNGGTYYDVVQNGTARPYRTISRYNKLNSNYVELVCGKKD